MFFKCFLRLCISLCLLTLAFLFTPQTAFGQAEKLGIVSYTPPKGWTKTPKENVVGFSEINQATGRFCIITLYGATPGSGSSQVDFAHEWDNLLVKTFAAKNVKGNASPATLRMSFVEDRLTRR